MTDDKAKEIINKIFTAVFDRESRYSLDEILEKFAFDIKLPKQVYDFITNEVTWADSICGSKFITLKNMEEKDAREGWMLEKRNICNFQDVIDIWNEVNLITTERVYDSIDVCKSDTIYGCEKVYRCTDSSNCKNIIFCDSCGNSEFLLASSRTTSSNFCIRCDDSKNCSNSYNVICSSKISNSLFIQDCYDLDECIFCSHIASKKYCIANMQFEREEYFVIKQAIVSWILDNES